MKCVVSSVVVVRILHLCRASVQKLKVMGPILLTGLNKVIDEPTEV